MICQKYKRNKKDSKNDWLSFQLFIFILLFCTLPELIYSEESSNSEVQKEKLWSLRSTISYLRTGGNSSSETFAGKIEPGYQSDFFSLALKAEYIYAKSKDLKSTDKFLSEGRMEYLFNKRFSAVIQIGYIRDRFSGYRYRLLVGPGAAYNFVRGEKQLIEVSGSLNYSYDRYLAGLKFDDDYLSAKLSGCYAWKMSANHQLKQNLNYLVAFSKRGKYFFDSETIFEVRISRVISIGTSFKYNYQHKPPADEIKKIDTTFLINLIFDWK